MQSIAAAWWRAFFFGTSSSKRLRHHYNFSPVWQLATRLSFLMAALGCFISMYIGSGSAWDTIDLWSYRILGGSLLVCWLLMMPKALMQTTSNIIFAATLISALFLATKMTLLLLLAAPNLIVSEVAESFTWLVPLLLLNLLPQNVPGIRPVMVSLLLYLSAAITLYSSLHWHDPAIHFAINVLLQTLLAAWATALGVQLYLPQQERLLEHGVERLMLEKLAYNDVLTGLPNRSQLERELEHYISQANATPSAKTTWSSFGPHLLTLLFIDIDSFKLANDTLGYAQGDQILKMVAQLLKAVTGPDALVCRLSGDEFVIALFEQNGKAGEILGQKIQQQLLMQTDDLLSVTVSIGISVYPDDAQTPTDLLRHAGSAMYAVKRSGKQDVRRYLRMDSAIERDQHLARDLSAALRHQELSLVYQPLFDLRTHKVTKVEALLRWQHPEFGAVSPDSFINIAEQVGLIGQLGEWVLREACHTAQAWPDVIVCVNVSALQLLQPHFVLLVKQILLESQLPPQRLELELTETLAMYSNTLTTTVLDALQQLDVALCIDDFGTGYSNLMRLHTLPIQGLKLDRSFTAALGGTPESRAYSLMLIQTVSQIGQIQGLDITIEGIETPYQFQQALASGCALGQGYLLSRPVSAAEFGSRLGAWRLPEL